MKNHQWKKINNKFIITILVGTAIFIMACSLSFSQLSSGANETKVAEAIESTMSAEWERATTISRSTSEAIEPTPSPLPPTETMPPVEMTTAPPTEIPPIPSATEALTPRWYLSFTAIHWAPMSTGCKNMSAKCYKLIDDIKILEVQSDAILTAADDIRVEESWPSPYLVFWNQGSLKYQAYVNIVVDGKPVVGRFIPPGEFPQWKEEYLDLSAYKGKKVRIQFVCPVGNKKVNFWMVNGMRVEPDFHPEG